MAKSIVSFFDNFPEYNGRKIEIRGTDGYFSAKDMSVAMNKRFRDWTRTKFAKELLDELSNRSRIPIRHDEQGSVNPRSRQTPLIDYIPGDDNIFIHPYVAMSYSMSDPRFQARVNIWIVNLMTLGVANPHIIEWTIEQSQRGIQFNRDDIAEMYG